MTATARTTPAVREQLAARADAARARLRRATPEMATNALTAAEILALDELRLAELVATDHFGWRLAGDLPRMYETKPTARGVAYSTRPFHPCQSADDDRLALRLVKHKFRHLLGSMAEALMDLARARSGEQLHPIWVPVLAPKGDFCRALLLIASTAWQADRAARGARVAGSTVREAQPERGKEARHGLDDRPDTVHQHEQASQQAEQPQEDPHVLTTDPAASMQAGPARAEPALSREGRR